MIWPQDVSLKPLSEHAVPLHKIQTEILGLLAASRDPESYVAGSTPLNRNSARFSGDIDIFHDRAERVAQAAANDARILQDAGYRVAWIRQLPTIHSAEIRDGQGATKLEWAMDSDFRFFPTLRDALFGYVLHPVDLGMNKVLAAAGRRELRDIVDLIGVHDTVLPLGAIVWAAVEKSPGFTPEGLIGEIRRNLNHPAGVWRSLAVEEPLDPAAIVGRVREILDAAETFVRQMPTDVAGLLFLEGTTPVQPDPARLDRYVQHAGQRRGQWPSNAEITAAMWETYRSKPGQ
ncbi:MAG: hypothetical protein ACK46Q_10695 [Hyphomonas sp.]